MPDELIVFITNYGYLGIFILVFTQEIGIPNPVPNELVLMFAANQTSTGILNIPFVIHSAVSADFTGTNLLYIIFYFFGGYIVRHKPCWIPISSNKIEKYSKKYRVVKNYISILAV
jgi:membrane protein DedA with SNARE-associated domain